MKRLPWFASFAMFLVLCASVAYWAMQLLQPPPRAVAAVPQAEPPEPSPDAARGLFGGSAVASLASNYQLKGVVAAVRREDSVAILSADSKPAKAVAAGGELTPGVIVREVHPQYVLLSESGAIKRVELAVPVKGQAGAELPLKAPSVVTPGTSSVRPTTLVPGPDTNPPPAVPPGPQPSLQPQPAVPAGK
ncbi:type II secretion system protein N [Herminiimonas sp. CN]|uniref:type II secretion system protein N n=1 Tax=Herminiimonas sp. CN TaxID=1349818 RepID=UPI0004739671|nr:type II secretion system protein N [Herminiimonas sp. CN]